MNSQGVAAVCARQHRTEVPYGVIQMKNGMMETIVEKPAHEDLISAGIYAFSPEALSFVPKNTPIDMPAVLASLIKSQKKVAVFPMRESWIDVGRPDDLETLRHQFGKETS